MERKYECTDFDRVEVGRACESEIARGDETGVGVVAPDVGRMKVSGAAMEINMRRRQSPFCLPDTRVAACPATACLDTPRLGRFVRGVARAGTAFLDWLNRLGARRIDPEGLEKMRTRTASLRIKGIGH